VSDAVSRLRADALALPISLRVVDERPCPKHWLSEECRVLPKQRVRDGVDRGPEGAAPDLPCWSGRRRLAAIDAIAWPVGLWVLLGRVPGKSGLVLPMASAVLVLWGLSRFHKAVWRNHRYRFTTWRVLGILAVLVIVGLVLKIAVR